MLLSVQFEPAQGDQSYARHRRFRLESSRGRIVGEVAGEEPSWLAGTFEELNELLDLPVNWNSYGARMIDPQSIVHAMNVLGAVVTMDSPRPHVVPTVSGGVQFEWHLHDIDLEADLHPNGRAEMFFGDRRTGVEREQDLDADLAPLKQAMAELTRRHTVR